MMEQTTRQETAPPKPEPRNASLDLLRGLAAMLMILGHSILQYPVNLSDVPWCSALSHWIYTFHMELFFVLSGAVYRRHPYREMVRSKSRRLLLPYVFFGLLAMVLMAVGGQLVNGTRPLDAGLKKFLFYGGNYWFIYTLFVLFLVYPLLDRLPDGGQLLLAVGLALLTPFDVLPAFLQIRVVVRYLPYFILGRLVLRRAYRGDRLYGAVQTKIGLALAALATYLASDYSIGEQAEITFLHYIRAFSMIALLALAVDGLTGFQQRQKQKQQKNSGTGWLTALVTACSTYSLQLYLFNPYILVAARTILCSWLHLRTPFLLVALLWTSNLAVTLFACRRIIPRIPWLAVLTGLPVPKIRSEKT